jgi:hypothetical protein
VYFLNAHFQKHNIHSWTEFYIGVLYSCSVVYLTRFSININFIAPKDFVIVNNKSEKMWKVKFVSLLKVLTCHFSEQSKENRKKFRTVGAPVVSQTGHPEWKHSLLSQLYCFKVLSVLMHNCAKR